MLKLVAEFEKFVDFHVVYIREAHPIDGWAVPEDNLPYGVEYSSAKTLEERQAAAIHMKN